MPGRARKQVKEELHIEVDERIARFLEEEAILRGVTAEQIGEFALELFTHYSSEIRNGSAVVLHPPAPEEPLRYIVYATTIAKDRKLVIEPDPDRAQAPDSTYALYVRAGKGKPRLRSIDGDKEQ